MTAKKLTSGLSVTLAGDVRQALKRLVKRRDIRIITIEYDQPGSQTALMRISYKNLRALDPVTRTLQIPMTPIVTLP